jgi:spermidine synthase
MSSVAQAMRAEQVLAAESSIGRWLPLFLVSAASLLLELAVIRWLSAEVRLFSYFKNLPLLAAFLGLGIGFGVVGRGRDYRPAFAPLLAVFTILVLVVGGTDPVFLAYPGTGDEFMHYMISPQYWLAVGRFLGAVLLFFVLTMLLFIPLGQATGEEMARHAPLPAYIVNIVASVAGVWAFALLSFLETPPVMWFGTGLLAVGIYLAARQALSRVAVAIALAVLVALTLTGRAVIWSPYQRLEVREINTPTKTGGTIKIGYELDVQRTFFQHASDFSPAVVSQLQSAILVDWAAMYELPYRLRPPGSRVLIVGAGMGNDTAAALRNGVAHVMAVEIDPAIIETGRRLHPERPYSDPRVITLADDARAFFRRNSARYDIIAFGLLDAHTLLSGLSNVRLDSFVFTLESLQEAKRHLTEGGLVSINFVHSAPWVTQRLGRMLTELFGAEHVFSRQIGIGTAFVAGAISPEQLAAHKLSRWQPDPAAAAVPMSTDDWPYLYLRARKIPAAYWQMFLLIGVACFVLMARFFPAALRPDWHFWLLGAAFLLIEFKSITEMALLFGTTWLVNALAITGVLMMVLAANVVSLWRPALDLRAIYACLFGSLALAYFFPLDALNVLGPALRALASMVLLSLPIFFAGLIFAQSLRRAGETARPLASNLSGTVAGGVLEYGSLLWGIKSLYILGALVYAGALLAARGGRR